MSRYIIQDIKEYAAQGMTPKELRNARVFLVLDSRNPKYRVGKFSAYGWVVECKSKTGDVLVVPITQLFVGVLSDYKLYRDVCPEGSVWEWDDKYQGRDSFIPTKRKLLDMIEAKFTNDNVWGYYDIMTPITPTNRASRSFFDWGISAFNRPGPPKIPIIRSKDPRAVDDVYNHMIAALSKISAEPYIGDTILVLAEMRTFLKDADQRGVLTLSAFVNSFLASWQKMQKTTQFASILTSVYWPSYRPGSVEERLRLWRESPDLQKLLVGKGVIKKKDNAFKNIFKPKRGLTRSERRTKARRKSRLAEIEKATKVEFTEWKVDSDLESQSAKIFDFEEISNVDDLSPEDDKIRVKINKENKGKGPLKSVSPEPVDAGSSDTSEDTIIPVPPSIKVNNRRIHCQTYGCLVCNGEPLPETYEDWLKEKRDIANRFVTREAKKFYGLIPRKKEVGEKVGGWWSKISKWITPSDETHKKSENVFTNFLNKWDYHVRTSGIPVMEEGREPPDALSGVKNFIGFTLLTPILAGKRVYEKQRDRFKRNFKHNKGDKFLTKFYKRTKIIVLSPVFATLGLANSLLSGIGLATMHLYYGCKNSITKFKVKKN
ncbi:hypothetical protein QKS29_gp2 [Botrytis cinerea fusarivirus 7]|uniref:Uncharacterized protein n=1 Tax=Botrytis cinerea fusarivirus 7 TaxID=2735923 RepID=A0AAE7AQ97_9VIRU|nr:hypothetical protein QKS29_gp2 [Botrytis cinerea fusarivirus 7]QJT73722.1 hypothetical protein [Botrytis cinerea fusarivirus 7]